MVMPNRPISFICSTSSSGNSSRCSYPVATGSTSLSTNVRTALSMSCWMSVSPSVCASLAIPQRLLTSIHRPLPIRQERQHRVERVGLLRGLVRPVPQHPGEPQRHLARIARAALHPVEGDLHHQLGPDVHHPFGPPHLPGQQL